jgi:prophage maintenance system killer protein
MSKNLKPVTIKDFRELLEFAQQSHIAKNEPIPTPHKTSFDQISSCLQRPFQVVYGQVLYRGLVKKAAILYYFLIKNHLLENGNKRMANITLSRFCDKNGFNFDIPDDDYYMLSKTIASGTDKDESLLVIEASLRKYLKRID